MNNQTIKSDATNTVGGKTILDKLTLILKNWQERLIDVSKSNPLLGLNRSRAVRLPKGHIELGEDAVTAAMRETKEESGITDLKLVKDLGSY